MTGKLIALGVALLLTLAAPFVLRPDTGIPASDSGINTLTVITPHNESIRHEFGLAFATHMKLTRNQTVHIDWRTPGSGTADKVNTARTLKITGAIRLERIGTMR